MYAVTAPEQLVPSGIRPTPVPRSSGRPVGAVRRAAPQARPTTARPWRRPSAAHYRRRRTLAATVLLLVVTIAAAVPASPSVSERAAGLLIAILWIASVVGLLRYTRPARVAA